MKKKLVVGLILLVVLVIGGIIIIKKNKPDNRTLVSLLPSEFSEETIDPTVRVNESTGGGDVVTPLSENMVNIVFLGMGGEGHDGGSLTDSVTLASFNYAKKEVNLIAVPRDLWYSGRKINSVYPIEGSSGIKNNLSQITGLKVNYFISVDFAGFIKAVDALSGIEVDNPKYWEDNFYPVKGKEQELCGFTPEQNAELNQKFKGFTLEKQYTCRYEQLQFNQGLVALDGTTALKYIRSRHSAQYGSDFSRGERAQAVLLGIGKKLFAQSLLEPGNSALPKLVSLVSSDINLKMVPTILKTLGNVAGYTVKHTNLTDENVLVGANGPNGAYILVSKAGTDDFSVVRALITVN